MNRENFKEELKAMCYVLALLVFALKIAFHKEDISNIIITGIGIMWGFVLPGYILVSLWKGELSFLERISFGTILGAAVMGLAGYNLGLIGIHAKHHVIIIPLVEIIIGLAVLRNISQ